MIESNDVAELTSENSVTMMHEIIQNSTEKITLIAVGPLTNIALLLRTFPEDKEKIEQISIMGGSITRGNVTSLSEFNFFVDPEAAKIVFESGVKIIMAGLNVTQKASITDEQIQFLDTIETKRTKFAHRILKYYASNDAGIHDPCSVIVLDNPEVFETEDMYIKIDVQNDETRGMSYRDLIKEENGELVARDAMSYSETEIRRIAKRAFDIAMKRNKKVTSVDKANVIDTSRLWRKVVSEVAKDYPEVVLEHMLVDNCAMQLVKDPKQFDVILTENMFGDILSDEASMVTGSIGMLASASLRVDKFGMYEPSHGSAPDIAGKNIANPIATILSAAMMLRYSFDLDDEAKVIENAIEKVLQQGYRTSDIMSDNKTLVGTKEMGDLIVANL